MPLNQQRAHIKMDITSKLSLFDLLVYEAIGCMLLFMSGMMPIDFGKYSWLFYILAYVAGLIFAKLNENGPLFLLLRNNSYIITTTKNELDETTLIERLYIQRYYNLSEKKSFKTIQILEVQIAFLFNISILFFIAFILIKLTPEYTHRVIFKYTHSQENIISINCCCKQNTINIIDSFSTLLKIYAIQFAITILNRCFFIKNKKLYKYLSTIIYKYKSFIIVFLLISILILIFFGNTCLSLISFSIITLYICYIIQCKISYLVLEGGYYIK